MGVKVCSHHGMYETEAYSIYSCSSLVCRPSVSSFLVLGDENAEEEQAAMPRCSVYCQTGKTYKGMPFIYSDGCKEFCSSSCRCISF